MKFYELPEQVQSIAADLLAKKLDDEVFFGGENRTEKAKEIAQTVREAFFKLYDN